MSASMPAPEFTAEFATADTANGTCLLVWRKWANGNREFIGSISEGKDRRIVCHPQGKDRVVFPHSPQAYQSALKMMMDIILPPPTCERSDV